MSHRFRYVKYDEKHKILQEDYKNFFETLEVKVDKSLPEGRAKSLVYTKLEEAYMWIGKAIRDDQIASGGDATHVAGRTSE